MAKCSSDLTWSCIVDCQCAPIQGWEEFSDFLIVDKLYVAATKPALYIVIGLLMVYVCVCNHRGVV